MKKLIVSLILLMGLSFNANAIGMGATSAITSTVNIPFVMFPIAAIAFANTVEYGACNDLPYRTVSFKSGSNHSFDVSECDYQAKKDRLILK